MSSSDTIASRVRFLHHLALPVADLSRAEDFYVRVLGAEVTRRRVDEHKRRLGLPCEHISIAFGDSARIDLFPLLVDASASTELIPHFAFEVAPDELVRCVDILTRHGVACEGPLRQGPPGSASVYFNDPEGNHLELVCHGYPPDAPLPLRAPDPRRLAYPWPATPRRNESEHAEG